MRHIWGHNNCNEITMNTFLALKSLQNITLSILTRFLGAKIAGMLNIRESQQVKLPLAVMGHLLHRLEQKFCHAFELL
jgi:hypothetical protein